MSQPELREDLIYTADGQKKTAEILVDVLSPILADSALYQLKEA